MVTNKINAGIRLDAEDIAELGKLSKQLGLSKNVVMSQALRLFSLTHTQGASTKGKVSDSTSLSYSKGASTLPKSASTLKGMDAKAVLLEAKLAWIKSATGYSEQVLFHDGAIWLMGKDSHNQDWLKRLLEFPVELFNAVAKGKEYTHEHYTLAECRIVLDRWNALKAIPYIDQVTVESGQGKQESVFTLAEYYLLSDQHFQILLDDAVAAIEAYKLALEEATAAEEAVANEVAVSAEEVPASPCIEAEVGQLELSLGLTDPKPLTKKQFQVRYSIEGNDSGIICQQGKDSGWTAPDGQVWFYDPKAKLWSTEKAALSPVTRVMVIA